MKLLNLPAPDRLNPAEEWAAWQPSGRDSFGAKWAVHLYRRAGFGCTPVELREAVKDGLDKTLAKLFAPAKSPLKPLPPIRIPPVDPNNPVPNPINYGAVQIRAHWLNRMLSGQEPIRERMTLFWHNHFATSIAKIQDANLMERQNALIRKHALGKFGPFLKDMSRDAAMLIWLDSNQNVKAHPNENYAREIMELFALGVGNYKEKDVQEAARAFTGWHVTGSDESDRRFSFRSTEHDFGRKTILGQTGDWDGDDVIRILLEQKACSRFLVRKLYAFLVNENVAPPDAFLQPLCDELVKSDYDISVTVNTILRSRHFFSAHAYRQKVKSPIDYVLGAARMFGMGATGALVITPYHLLHTLELQGQQLYQPPNVKGWEGGKAWLNTATVLARHNFAYQMATGAKEFNIETARLTGAPFVVSVNPVPAILEHVRAAAGIEDREEVLDSGKVVEYMAHLTVPEDLSSNLIAKLVAHLATAKLYGPFVERCRDVLLALMSLPEYQVS